MKCLTAFILVFVFVSPFCWAQEPDTVYLKDGSIIKGEIIETTYTTDLRIETIKVRIAGGSILAFTGDKIQKIQTGQKESPIQRSPPQKSQPSRSKQITSYKNPGVACILSLVLFPGIGQIYNEQPQKGVTFLFTGFVGAVIWSEGSAFVGPVMFLGSWVVSGMDAYSSAKSINESLALSVAPNKISICYRF